jgi:hypothetical protein
MDYAKSMSGVAPFKMGFQINETLANGGIPVLEPPGNGAGVAISTTTSWAKAVGVTLDAGTYVAAQQTDGTSAEREVTVIINPDAIFRALMSGGATEGTALTLYPITSEASDGLTLTTSSIADWSSPQFDEGVAWFYDGVNAGQKRRVTSVSSSVATVTVPFDNGTVNGDNVLRAPYWFLGDAQTIQTTTNLYQANVAIAVATGGTAKIIDMELRDQADDGRSKSFVLFLFDDHALKTL